MNNIYYSTAYTIAITLMFAAMFYTPFGIIGGCLFIMTIITQTGDNSNTVIKRDKKKMNTKTNTTNICKRCRRTDVVLLTNMLCARCDNVLYSGKGDKK